MNMLYASLDETPYYLVPVGTPIERCPECDARVSYVVSDTGEQVRVTYFTGAHAFDIRGVPHVCGQPAPEYSPDVFDAPEAAESPVNDMAEEVIEESELEEPEVGGTVQLYDYQERAVNRIIEEHTDGAQGTLCVSATGSGKSVMMAELVRRYVANGHKVLILVHRDELIRQLCKSMGRVGLPVLIEKAQEKALAGFGMMADVVCASVQTLRGKRLESWPRDSFSLIVIDEAHHSIANGYLDCFRHFGWRRGDGRREPLLVGFTATADRLDGKNIGTIFDALAFEYNLRQAVKEGRLVKPVSITLDTDPPIDLSQIRTTTNGDFNAGDLEAVISSHLNLIVNAVSDDGRLGTRKAIGFTPDVNSAELAAAAFNKVGITAEWVAGNSKDRREKLEAHRRGDYQVLMNCMIATEGYDDPEIAAVLLMRPTKSRTLLSQMCGRGTRLCPSIGKTDCFLFDFNYLTQKHDLVVPVELFDDESVSDDVMAVAKEISEEEGGGDMEEILERAVRVQAERVRERIRRQKIPLRRGQFDPLGIADFFEIPVQKESYDWQNTRAATEKQLAALQKFGVAVTPDLPFVHAKKMLDVLISRASHGWSSLWQINALMDAGFERDAARGLRKEEAARELDTVNSQIPATTGQLWVLQSKYGVTPPPGLTKSEASKLLGQYGKGASR